MILSSSNESENQVQQQILLYDKKGRLTIETLLGIDYLTKRECEILKYILRGYSAKQIGLILKLSFRTVESYISILKLKFHCRRKSDLVNACMTLGIFKIFL